MTDLDGCMSVGFDIRPANGAAPSHDIELRFEKAGIAGHTKTQLGLFKKSPVRRPEWYQDLLEKRPCWRKKIHMVGKLYSVSLVMNPPNPHTSVEVVR